MEPTQIDSLAASDQFAASVETAKNIEARLESKYPGQFAVKATRDAIRVELRRDTAKFEAVSNVNITNQQEVPF